MPVMNYVQGTVESARRQVDRVVTPDARQQAYDAVGSFAKERPILASFLAFQALFSLLPILTFASFIIGTFAVAFISAVVFSLFWLGIAVVVLGSTLFVTSGLAVLAWAWVFGSYLASSFVYGLVFGASSGGKTDERKMMEEKLRRFQKHASHAGEADAKHGINGAGAKAGDGAKTGGGAKAGAGEEKRDG